jgi:hypothetical protein
MFQKYVLGLLLMTAVLCSMVNPLLVQEAPIQSVESDPALRCPQCRPTQSLRIGIFYPHTSVIPGSSRTHQGNEGGFCDPTVKAYTGYIDVEHGRKHLFFYFSSLARILIRMVFYCGLTAVPVRQVCVVNYRGTDLLLSAPSGGSSALGLLSELGTKRVSCYYL